MFVLNDMDVQERKEMIKPFQELFSNQTGYGLRELFIALSGMCRNSLRPIVLMIDEVDSATVKKLFEGMVMDWFSGNDNYNEFIRALLAGDVKAMNTYMNRVAREMFSYFDTGKSVQSEPERFYHGFVLGLMVEQELKDTVSHALRQIEEKD